MNQDNNQKQTAETSVSSTNAKKSKCFFNECKDKPAKIIGDCRYCVQKFCGKHRLPESHACDNMSTCRQDSSDKFASRLLKEKCVASKV